MLASILPRPLLLCFVWVCSPGSHLTALLPQAAPRLSSCPFMCLQLWKANSGARKMPHMYNAAAFTDSSYPLISCHYSWPLNSSQQDCCDFELTFFLVCVFETETVGRACTGVIISGQWENSMGTSTPHKAISLSTPAVRGVCFCMCVFEGVCLSLSPWVVIFMQPYGVTAQIINYSSPRERDSKRGSVTIPDTEGEQGMWEKLCALVVCRTEQEVVVLRDGELHITCWYWLLIWILMWQHLIHLLSTDGDWLSVSAGSEQSLKFFIKWTQSPHMSATSRIHANTRTQTNKYCSPSVFLRGLVTRIWTPREGLIRDSLTGTHIHTLIRFL